MDELGEGRGGVDGAVVGVRVHSRYEALGYLVSVVLGIFYGEDLERRHFAVLYLDVYSVLILCFN